MYNYHHHHQNWNNSAIMKVTEKKFLNIHQTLSPISTVNGKHHHHNNNNTISPSELTVVSASVPQPLETTEEHSVEINIQEDQNQSKTTDKLLVSLKKETQSLICKCRRIFFFFWCSSQSSLCQLIFKSKALAIQFLRGREAAFFLSVCVLLLYIGRTRPRDL